MQVAPGGHAGTHWQLAVVALHAWPVGHRRPVPHEGPVPQGLGMAVPHATASGDGAVAQVSVHTHAPDVQLCVDEHTVPQRPQLLRSVAVLTHVEPQSVRPVGHTQRPAEHEVPEGQRLPHAPQLFASVEVFTQAEPQ